MSGIFWAKIFDKVNKITTSKVLINILYAVISILMGSVVDLIFIIIGFCGFKYAGDNFPLFLLKTLILFSIAFFIRMKLEERVRKNK